MSSREDQAEGVTEKDRRKIAAQARSWTRRGNVFIYFIAGAMVRSPAAAMSLNREVDRVKK